MHLGVQQAVRAQTIVWSLLWCHTGPQGLFALTHVFVVAVLHMLPKHVPAGAAAHLGYHVCARSAPLSDMPCTLGMAFHVTLKRLCSFMSWVNLLQAVSKHPG